MLLLIKPRPTYFLSLASAPNLNAAGSSDMDNRPMDPKYRQGRGEALTHQEAKLLLFLLLLFGHFRLLKTIKSVLRPLEIFFRRDIGLGSNFGVSAIHASLSSANITSARPVSR